MLENLTKKQYVVIYDNDEPVPDAHSSTQCIRKETTYGEIVSECICELSESGWKCLNVQCEHSGCVFAE